jgi:hypothetical protein
MLVFKKKLFLLNIKQIWFSSYINFSDIFKITIYKQIDFNIKKPLFFFEKFHTLNTDLTIELENIFKNFNSTLKNEINKAKKDNFILNFNESSSNFLLIYNEFANYKNLPKISIDNILCYRDKIIFTSICKDNIILTVHSYLIDKELNKVRLLHSANSRFYEKYCDKIISRSNKFLHFNDIIYFKLQGIAIYDWGGIAYETNDKILIGINSFKKSFGGELVCQKNVYSPLYYLLLKLFK